MTQRQRNSCSPGWTGALLFTAILGVFGTPPAQADAALEFSGTLVSEPCKLATDSLEQTVEFGPLALSTVALRSGSVPHEFTIRLEECDLTAGNQVSVTLEGEEDLLQPGAFVVSGSASGIALWIESENGKAVLPNITQPAFELANGTVLLGYRAQIKAQDAKRIQAGDFTSVITFALAYE